MLVIKPITALAIVLFAQVNVFSHNFFSVKDAEMKLEKDNKKISKTADVKQSMSRLKEGVKMVAGKKLVKKFESNWLFVVPLKFLAVLENAARIAFEEIRLVWFGCCSQAS